jgi:transposase
MQQALLPHCLEDYVGEENPVRVIEVFIDELDLAALGFSGMTPAATGRPAYHPSDELPAGLRRRCAALGNPRHPECSAVVLSAN